MKTILLISFSISFLLIGCTKKEESTCKQYWDKVKSGDKFELCNSCDCTNMPWGVNDNKQVTAKWEIRNAEKEIYHVIVNKANNQILSITKELPDKKRLYINVLIEVSPVL